MSKNLLSAASLVVLVTACFLVSIKVDAQANYTEQERIALNKLRHNVRDVLIQDFQKLDSYLIRWLKARKMNVDGATEMLRASAKWRKGNNMASVLNETIFEFNPPVYSINGTSFEGGPVITWSVTRIDMRNLVASGNGDKLVRYFDQILEEGEQSLEKASKLSNGRVSQGVSLMDLHGFNIRQHTCLGCISTFLKWVQNYEGHHPQMAKHIVWINVPRAFIPVLELIKPLLSEGTSKALKVFPPDRKVWTTYIRKIVPADQLPFKFGGTIKD